MAFCKFFGECPVCKFQHLTYGESLKRKGERVRRAMETEVEVVSSPLDRGYKVRSILHVRKPEPGNLIVGYTLERGFVFGVDECPIMHPALSRLLPKINSVLAPTPLSVWDAEKGRGKLVSLTLLGDENGVILSLNLRRPVFVKRLTFDVMDRVPGIVGVWWSVGTFGEHITGGRGEIIRAFHVERETFKVSPYGEYPDNLSVLPDLWRFLKRTLEGRTVAFMTGLYVPPYLMTTYVDNRGMPIKEVVDTAKVYGAHPDVRQMNPAAFPMVSDEPYDFVILNADRVRDREVLAVGRRAVVMGRDVRRVKEMAPSSKPERVLMFDLGPYTEDSLVVALY